MQAITTKFIGPTNTRGTRIKARCTAGSVTVSWDWKLDSRENHVVAAQALLEKLEWSGVEIIGSGETHTQDFVHVLGGAA